MDKGFWIAVLGAGLGTYALRVLPLLWMQRHLNRRKGRKGADAMPTWLVVLGPTMIAAMLGASLVPASPSPAAWLATACAVLATFLTWLRTKSLSWPVVAGVLVYGMVIVVAG